MDRKGTKMFLSLLRGAVVVCNILSKVVHDVNKHHFTTEICCFMIIEEVKHRNSGACIGTELAGILIGHNALLIHVRMLNGIGLKMILQLYRGSVG